jgi:hypothetical protein
MAMIVQPGDEVAVNGSPHDGSDSHGAPQRGRNGATRQLLSEAVANSGFWTDAASKALRKRDHDADAAWDAYWSKRRKCATVARLTHAAGTPLAWGIAIDSIGEECRALVEIADELAHGADADKFAKGKHQARLREAVSLWLEEARDGDTDVDFAVGCLAAAHVLHQLGGPLGAEEGWPLLDFLAATSEDARVWEPAVERSANSALAQQLVAGELPLTLAYSFPEMKPLARMTRAARKQLASGLATLAAEKGLVRASQLAVLPALVACWTRCRTIGSQLDKPVWKSESQSQYQAAVRQALRWTDGQGHLLLDANDATAWTADFVAAAVRASNDGRTATAARAQFAGSGLDAEVPAGHGKAPRPSTFAEKNGLALLRSDWGPDAATVAIDFSSVGMRIAAASGRWRLFDGVWTASSRRDGQLLKPAGEWDAVCWFSDKDVDYIEFQLDLDGGARLERQVLLARKDGFLLLADHLQSSAAAALEPAWQLPLGEGLAWCGEAETRDARLAHGDVDVARLLPLALPEWRVDPRMGELANAGGALRLAQHTSARAMACPLFIDLRPHRIGRPCTWRQLTVAEALQIQPPDVAVGYRVQCGKKQWLIYRSQAARGNRTVLGQNTSSEFLAARFLSPSGDVEQLIMVEG